MIGSDGDLATVGLARNENMLVVSDTQ